MLSLLGGGGGVVLGGLAGLVLALSLGVWLAVRRAGGDAGQRRPDKPSQPPTEPAAADAAAGGSTLTAPAAPGASRLPAHGPAVPEPRLAAPAPSPVQAEISAQLRRLAEARASRAAPRPAGRPATAAAPAEQALGPVPAPAAALDDTAGPAARTAPVVLVVDDSRIVRVMLSRLLAPRGWTVREAASGDRALALLRESPADLLITDAGMPGLDGFALTRAVRADPALAGLPVIMVTGDDDRHRDEAARAGVSMLVGKPYGEAALLAHIRRLCPAADQAPAHRPPARAAEPLATAPDWAVPTLSLGR